MLVLAPLKRVVLRLFGYRGAMDFTLYPDTWVRDLPLLDIGPGAYLSNKATIGTNVVLSNGRLLVDRVQIGERALVGHLAMIAPGVVLEARAEIGVGAGIGFSTRVATCASVGPMSTIEHGVVIGAATRIGAASYIGSGSRLAPGLRIPAGAVIPARTELPTQAAVDALLGTSAKETRRDRRISSVSLERERPVSGVA